MGGHTVELTKTTDMIFCDTIPEKPVMSPEVIRQVHGSHVSAPKAEAEDEVSEVSGQISPIIETQQEQASEDTSNHPTSSRNEALRTDTELKSHQVSFERLTNAGERLREHFKMRQTAPRQMMVNGHLHQVQDLESFNKLRSQENNRQASVAAQTSGPLTRLPMSAE